MPLQDVFLQPTGVKMRNGELLSGAIPMVLGVVCLVGSRNLHFGTLTHMGPGFVPISLSVLLFLFGVLILIRGLRSTTTSPPQWPALRPLIAISACPVLFALLIERAGLVISIIAVCVAARMAVPVTKNWEIVLVPAGTAAFCVGVFVIIMDLPLPVFGK
jgi:hypothetical protein